MDAQSPSPPPRQAFVALLAKRNIDATALQAALPEVYRRWIQLFESSHPDSFLAQIRFEINAVRRQVQGLLPLAVPEIGLLGRPPGTVAAPDGSLAARHPAPGPVGQPDAGVAPLQGAA